jgi:hypothetical protein
MTFPATAARALQYGLGIFTLTALIGLANATKIFGELSPDTLLTHLHSGTLGWITMGVFAVALALFARSGAIGPNVTLTALATGAYVLAFWSGNFPARAIFGTVMLATIVWWWAWVAHRSYVEGFRRISNPKLAMVLGLTTLVIGSTVGVIIQIQFALNTTSAQTADLVGTHASAQVGGYLILVATGIIEWLLIGETRTRGGTAQSALLFLAGLTLAAGQLFSVQPLLIVTNVLQIVATVMVIVRLGPALMRTAWGAAAGGRHAAIVPLYLVIGVVLIVALVQQVIAAQGDIGKVPPGLIHSLDHTFFIGVMTNALFGVVFLAAADRPRLWPWADHLIFWGLNAGVLAFTAVLAFVGSSAGAGPFSHPVAFTAPVMGLAALLGIVTFSARLAASPAAMRAPSPA